MNETFRRCLLNLFKIYSHYHWYCVHALLYKMTNYSNIGHWMNLQMLPKYLIIHCDFFLLSRCVLLGQGLPPSSSVALCLSSSCPQWHHSLPQGIRPSGYVLSYAVLLSGTSLPAPLSSWTLWERERELVLLSYWQRESLKSYLFIFFILIQNINNWVNMHKGKCDFSSIYLVSALLSSIMSW